MANLTRFFRAGVKASVTATAFLSMAGIVFFGGVSNFGPKHASAGIILVSDFDDGTLQGWSPEPFFGGNLLAQPTGGNPGGYMVATDTVPGGGCLCARAPGSVSGDLSLLGGIGWDEFSRADAVISSSVIIEGTDGTQYGHSMGAAALPAGVWSPRFVSFEISGWVLRSGTGTAIFNDVVTNTIALFLDLDITLNASGNFEAGIDNVFLVGATSPIPTPAALPLFLTGLAGLGLLRRRKRKAMRD